MSRSVAVLILFAATVAAQLSLHRRGLRSVQDVAREAQRLRARWSEGSGDIQRRSGDIPLTDLDGDVNYFTNVSIGTPLQTLSLVIDTATSNLWVLSPACKSIACAGATTFDSNASSTFLSSSQPLNLTYGNENALGSQATDIVFLGNFFVPNQALGLVTTISDDLLRRPMSGIMGLAFPLPGQPNTVPFWLNLYNANQLTQPVMGFAIDRGAAARDNVAETTEPGGSFTIGSLDSSLYSGDIDFVNVTTTQFWTLPLAFMEVNGHTIPLHGQLAAINTASFFIGGPEDQVAQIMEQVPGAQPGTGNLAGVWLYDCSAQVELSISFGSRTWAIAPGDFSILEVEPGTCAAAVAPFNVSSLPGQATWIVGDPLLKNVYAVFNFASPPMVGFADRAGAGATPSPSGGANGTSAGSPEGGPAIGAKNGGAIGLASREGDTLRAFALALAALALLPLH